MPPAESVPKPLLRILVPAVAIALAIAGWNWWNSDARRIARQLEALTDEVAKKPGESNLTMAFKSEQAARFFAEPFRFRARQFDFETDHRATLTRTIAAYRLRSDRIAPRVLHRELEIDSASGTARMQLLVRFAGGLRGRADEAFRFQLNWVEQEGEWKIAYADLIEIVPASVL